MNICDYNPQASRNLKQERFKRCLSPHYMNNSAPQERKNREDHDTMDRTHGGLNKTSIQGFMESNAETGERVTYKERELRENQRIILEATIAELAKTKEELSRAKESAMQSWLNSKPLIDEVERQKSNLANAQQRLKTSDSLIAELESQLETINQSIKSKREDHLKTETMIHEINHTLDQTRSEMERFKLDRKEEKQALAKLRQILHLRKQTVQTMQLTLQAVLLESDAVEVSTAKALHQISHSETHNDKVQLTHEDYYALTRRAKEKFSRANWRVSASMEQKLAAEATHELALSRLNKFYTSMSWSMNRRNMIGQWHAKRDVKKQDAIVEGEITITGTGASRKAHAKYQAKSEGKKLQSRSGSKSKKLKKKSSILHQIKKFLVQRIRKLRG